MKKMMKPSIGETMMQLMLVLVSATVVAGGDTVDRDLHGNEEHICFNGYVMDKCTYCLYNIISV